MECNKDEAVRAKEIAEKKMHENDFDGARRVALKAQQLYPELENISQLLTVCNVHCSAEKKILGSEKDWYGVLQIERLADEATIKKQYRKLALVLHPDKNKFPGAEAAFKLIGEAHVVLSDPHRRTVYDSKVRVVQATTTSYKANTNPPARKQSAVQNNAANGFSSQFGGWNQYPATQYNSTAVDESFWTCCPFCKIKYMFYRNLQNKMLRCQKCLKTYIAYEIAAQCVPGSDQSQATAQRVPGSNQSQATAQRVPGSNQSQAAAQGVPPTFNRSQPGVSRQKDDPVQGIYGTSGLKAGGPMAPGFGSQGNASGGGGPVGSASGTEMRSNAKVGLDNKTKDGQKEGAAMPKADKLRNEAECREKSRKRGRKPEQESSASCDTSDSSIMDDIDMKETSSGPAGGASFGVNASDFVRRSHRQKHQVSYNENETDDDDFESPKRSRKEDSSNGEGEPEAVVNDVPSFAKPTEQKRRVESPGVSGEANSQTAGQTATVQNGVAREFELVDVSDSDDDGSGGKSFLVPDAEFNNFDKLREEEGFAVDQFWACYDDADGMPRFYAQIRKVNSSPFRLRITWLEFSPNDQGERDWETGGLPIGCGKFKRGDSQDETNIGVFSHKMVCQKGAQRGSWLVYPRKGEIWALFKDWDFKWSTDSDNHKHWKYEIVEVISDFMEGAGVKVAYLERLRGFVSLFQHRSQNRVDSVLVPAVEMLRFSHCIPFFKMSGTEKEGVPKGSYELDPACLPANPEDVFCPSDSDAADGKSTRAEAKCSKPAKMNRPETVSTPKKPTEHLRKNDVGGETDKVRRSPRGQKNAVLR